MNAATGATFGQAGMLPFVEMTPHYSYILPKRKVSSSVLGNAFGMAESAALVSNPGKPASFLMAVDRCLKSTDRAGLYQALEQIDPAMESWTRPTLSEFSRGLSRDNRDYTLQLLHSSPSSRMMYLLGWLFPCVPESGGGYDPESPALKETCRNLFLMSGIGSPILIDELFPKGTLPSDIQTDYFRSMTLQTQIHSADAVAVTAMGCGA